MPTHTRAHTHALTYTCKRLAPTGLLPFLTPSWHTVGLDKPDPKESRDLGLDSSHTEAAFGLPFTVGTITGLHCGAGSMVITSTPQNKEGKIHGQLA